MTKKPARNSLCPCGSGRKYKKCCMPPEERDLFAPDATASLGGGFVGGQGGAASLVEFLQPLLDEAGHDSKEIDKALHFGMLLWNIAALAEAAGEETAREQLSEIENELCNSVQDCRVFRDTVRVLFERYARTQSGARVNMPGIMEGLWGRDLSKGMPKLGWRQKIVLALRRFAPQVRRPVLRRSGGKSEKQPVVRKLVDL